MTRSKRDKDPIIFRNALIFDLWNKGVPQNFIAKVFGITAARVCQIVGRMHEA